MSNKMFFLLSTLVFTFAAALHGIRTAFGWELTIADYAVPNWMSAVTFLVTGFLAYTSFKKLRNKPTHFNTYSQ